MAPTPRIAAERWLALVAGLFLQACGGNTYSFGIWSGAFKDRMGYSQQMLDGLGTAKDIGDNVAIIAGTLYDYLPIWALLLIGSLQNIFGIGGLWLAASGRVPKPPFWLACVLICVGTNGATFFQIAAVVTLIRNFPSHRGAVVGLTKGFVGLSGAIFTQVYYAAFAPDQTSFLLLITIVPPLMALLCFRTIRPLPPTESEDEEEEEHANFLTLYPLGFSLAAFLLISIISRETFRISHGLEVAMTTTMVLILASLLIVPIREYWRAKKNEQKQREELEGAVESAPLIGTSQTGGVDFGHLHYHPHVHDEANNWLDIENRAESIAYGLLTEAGEEAPRRTASGTPLRLPRGSTERTRSGTHLRVPTIPEMAPSGLRGRATPGDVEQAAEGDKRWDTTREVTGGHLTEEESDAETVGELDRGCYIMPKIGMDHGVLEAFGTLDFWVLFLSTACGAGSGLTAINNLAQVGASMGAGDSVGSFVSLISIWSFLGRLGAGLVSEHYVRTYGTPRPAFSLITQAIMGAGHLLFASALPGSLYLGSLIVGLCYGAQWTLMPAIASELFGLAHFGAIMAWQSVANPTGSYILSVLVAGYLYDKEADKEHGHVPYPTGHPGLGGADLLSFPGGGNGSDSLRGVGVLKRQKLFEVESLNGKGGSWLGRLWGVVAGRATVSKTCTGAHCFRLTFIIMAGVCFFGVLLNVWLTMRTREYYRGVWKDHLEKMANRESEKGSVAGEADGPSEEVRA